MSTDPDEPASDPEFDSVDGLLDTFFRDEGRASASPIADDDFGPFRILAPLGQGGMGQVFLAEQQSPVRRQVALKILRTGLDSRALLLRFAAEQQVLARMNHDGIAKVFETGCSRLGRPFFAMEYVPGQTITDWCDRNGLAVEQRLELFLHVCDGVQHAHDNAVLHRDLKPGNILVAAQGSKVGVKLIDFGLARALDAEPGERAAYSRFGAVLGTPDYMSPEQASGSAKLTAATDVYSLGVVLFELLVGVRPFDGLDRDSPIAAQQRIVHEAVPLPSSRLRALGERGAALAARRNSDVVRLASRLRGNLDWIVLRCLHKEQAQRYASARALGDDVAAFLAGRPVTARAETRIDRLRRWVRRSPGLAGGLAVAAISVLTSAIVLWQNLSLRRAADEATRVAAAGQQRAGDPRLLHDLVDPERLLRMPYEAQRSVLEVALQANRRRLDMQQDTPAVRAEVADAHVEIGTALRKLGRVAEAREALTTAQRLAEGLLAAGDAGGAVRACGGRAADGLAQLAREDGEPQKALPLAQAAVADLRTAVAADATRFRAALAEALGTLVETLYDLGRPQQALEIADEHLALLEADAAAAPGTPPPLTDLLRAHYSRGVALHGTGRTADARDTLQRAVDLGEASARTNPLDADARFLLLANRRLLARMLLRLAGDKGDGTAGQQGEKALADVRALVAEYPGSFAYLDQLARGLQFVAEVARLGGDCAAGRAPAEEALQVAVRVLESASDYQLYVDTGQSCLVTAGRIRIALGEVVAVAADAEGLAARLPALRMGVAQLLAQCAGATAAPETTSFADRAVAQLRQMDTTTPPAVKQIIWSRDFYPLRPRPDFNALVPAPKDRVDDRESTVPVPAQWLCGQTGDQVARLVDAGWRITDFELETAEPKHFAVAAVRNEGVHRRDVVWLADADAATVNAACTQRNARVADFATVVSGALPRFAAILHQRDDVCGWLWFIDVATRDIVAACDQNHARPHSLSVGVGTSSERLSASLIGNHQWDFREWRVRTVSSSDAVRDHLEGWRFTDLARLADDSLCIVETKSRVDGQRLLLAATATAVLEQLETHGCRVAAFCSYERSGQRLYDAVLNPNR